MKSRIPFMLFTIHLVLFGCQLERSREIPDNLLGIWKTSSPEYADRFFEIDKNRITFGTGEKNAAMHPILRIEEDHKGRQTLYDIYYANLEGQEYKLSLYYFPVRGTIRFENQGGIEWTRQRQ